MKKIGVFGAILLAACILGLPPVLGNMTAARIEQRVADINANPSVQIEIEDYDRGWFASTARLVVGLSPASLAQLNDVDRDTTLELLSRKLTVLLDIAQGPISTRNGLHLGWSSIVARPDPEAADNVYLRQQLGMDELFEWRGRVAYTGSVEFTADVPPIDYASELTSFSTAAWHADGMIRRGRMLARSSLPSLYYAAGPVSVALYGVSTDSNNDWSSRNIALGDFELLAESAVVANGLDPTGGPLLEARGLGLVSHMQLDQSGTLMSGSMDCVVAAATTQGGTELTDGLMRVGVDSLDVASLQAYADIVRRMDPAADPDSLLAELSRVIESLLGASPSLSFEPIRVTVDGESLEANIRVMSDPSALQAGVDWQDPAFWTRVLSLDADATVSKPLAETLAVQFVRTQLGAGGQGEIDQLVRAQAGFLLVTLAGQGMLRDQGQHYAASLQFEAGNLLLNGNPLPFGLP